MASDITKGQRARSRVIHKWPVRLTHWVNAIAIVMMIGSGWQIYDASPLFGFTFPPLITIGGWLGAAIAWHLAFMWLLVANTLVYLIYSGSSGHFAKFWPLDPREAFREIGQALTFKLGHQRGVYNAVQRLLYVGVLLAIMLVIISGLAIWKPVQLWFFLDPLGGYFVARYVHFFAMSAIVAFMIVHILLALVTPRVIPPMILGGRIEP